MIILRVYPMLTIFLSEPWFNEPIPWSFERFLLFLRVFTTLTIFRLELSASILSCIDFVRARQGVVSPTSALTDSQLPLVSHESRSSATSVRSVHAVSDFEAISYYLGVSDDHPLFAT
jgi:hypothetical protein